MEKLCIISDAVLPVDIEIDNCRLSRLKILPFSKIRSVSLRYNVF